MAESKLGESENLLHQTHPAFLAMKWKQTLLLILVLILDVIYILFFSQFLIQWFPNLGLPLLNLLMLGLNIIIIVYFLYHVLVWRANVYTLTDKRVIIQSGIINQNFEYIFLNKIESFKMIINLWDRILRTGTFEILTSTPVPGKSEAENPTLFYVPNPKQFEQLLRDAIDGAN
ncbi:MAG: PH domain-containing protein [Candidatus Hermodarchaeota archaeon]